jgi:hypothetical protein
MYTVHLCTFRGTETPSSPFMDKSLKNSYLRGSVRCANERDVAECKMTLLSEVSTHHQSLSPTAICIPFQKRRRKAMSSTPEDSHHHSLPCRTLSHLSSPVCAAITKCLRLANLQRTEIYFSQFWSLGSPKSRC